MLEQMTRGTVEYRIGRGEASALSALPGIDHAAGAIFSEEDIPAQNRVHGLPQVFFEDAFREDRLFVANEEPGGAPIGFAATTQVDGSLHLFQVSVLPAHGRKGVGRALVEAVLQEASEHGESGVTLTTFRHLPWNAPFYRKLGFEILTVEDLGPELAECLAKEARDGLDPAKRVAMRRVLGPT